MSGPLVTAISDGPAERLTVTEIIVRNVLMHEYLRVLPGTITLVEGGNETGKTSFLEAIRAVFRGGHDPALLRAGAEEGFVELHLSDGTVIRKEIWPDASNLKVTHPERGKISKGKTLVDSLVDDLGVDPFAFWRLKPKEKAAELVTLCDVRIPHAEIEAAAGQKVPKSPGTVFDQLAAARQVIYDLRTGDSRVAREKLAAAEELLRTLPQDPGTPEDVKALEEAHLEIEKTRERVLAETKAKFQSDLDARAAEATRTIEAAKRAAEMKLEKLRSELLAEVQGVIEDANAAAAADAAGIQENRADHVGSIEAEYAPKIEAAKIAAAVAAEKKKAHEEAAGAREIQRRTEAEGRAAAADAEAKTLAIKRLDDLRLAALSKLPVPGLEIRDGLCFYEDVPVERLNQESQYELSMKLAALRAGRLGLIVGDDVQAWDDPHWWNFERWARAAGLQFIVARVRKEGGPLSVTTFTEGATETKKED